MIQQMRDIRFSAREKIVETDDVVTPFNQPVAEVTAQESRTACH
jgi:hypothetical protein